VSLDGGARRRRYDVVDRTLAGEIRGIHQLVSQHEKQRRLESACMSRHLGDGVTARQRRQLVCRRRPVVERGGNDGSGQGGVPDRLAGKVAVAPCPLSRTVRRKPVRAALSMVSTAAVSPAAASRSVRMRSIVTLDNDRVPAR